MKVRDVINQNFAFSLLPNWVKETLAIQSLINNEISKIEKALGEEETSQLVSKIENEAYAQINPNSKYILHKLHEIQKELKNGTYKKS